MFDRARLLHGWRRLRPAGVRLLLDALVVHSSRIAVQDDLGCYFYSVPDPSKPWKSERRESYIELYWAVIGLVARAIGTDVEDLAVVVLAHELAHAYTHVGCDIDGESWSSSAFCAADRALTEGLAQYYTFRVCDKIKMQLPGVLGAFDTLLQEQPKPYQAHRPWLQDNTPEQVRLAMLQTRRNGTGKVRDFEASLGQAKDSLRRNRPTPGDSLF